jgi:hypothetical protein
MSKISNINANANSFKQGMTKLKNHYKHREEKARLSGSSFCLMNGNLGDLKHSNNYSGFGGKTVTQR